MKTIVISVGGSIIVPSSVDVVFLKKFRSFILSRPEQFVIYCGGGSIARTYQDALRSIIGDDHEALDWTGISASHLNAMLMRSLFGSDAESEVIQDPHDAKVFKKKVLVAGGWKPGWSTDFDAVLVAKNIGADAVINMSNIDYVYDSDPKKNKSAKPLKEVSWKDFQALVGDTWKPGLNMPFDPIASKEASKSNLSVYIVGKDLNNLENILEGKKFIGTLIS